MTQEGLCISESNVDIESSVRIVTSDDRGELKGKVELTVLFGV